MQVLFVSRFYVMGSLVGNVVLMASSRDYDWRSGETVSGDGAVAQLVERLLSMQKVCGSIPHCSSTL